MEGSKNEKLFRERKKKIETAVRHSLVEQVMVVLLKERPLLATERKLSLSFDPVVSASTGFNFKSLSFLSHIIKSH